MLSLKHFLKLIFESHQVSQDIGGQLLSFNKSKSQVEVVNRGGGKNGFKASSIALLIFGFFNILRIVDLNYSIKSGSKGLNKEVETNLCIMVFFMAFVTGDRYKTWGYSPETFVSFLNGIINMNMYYLKDVPSPTFPKSKYAYMVLRVTGVLRTWIFPYAIPICCLLEKTIPFNAMGLPVRILEMCNCELPHIVEAGLIIITNYLILRMMAKQAYCLGADLLVGVVSLTFCHEMANRNHVYYARCQHFTTGNCAVIPSSIIVCRAIPLLVELYNDAMKSQLFALMVGCGVTEIASAVVLINQETSNNLPVFLKKFFVILVIQSVVGILGLYGFAGDFNQVSKISLSKMNHQMSNLHLENMPRMEKKFRRALSNSFQVQKIKFGLSNHIEKRTPAVFELFCLERIID